MKFYTIVMTGLVVLGAASLAFGNPAMLPKHPGYPSGGEYANDTGQKNLTVEQSLSRAAASEDAHTGQKLADPNDAPSNLATAHSSLIHLQLPCHWPTRQWVWVTTLRQSMTC